MHFSINLRPQAVRCKVRFRDDVFGGIQTINFKATGSSNTSHWSRPMYISLNERKIVVMLYRTGTTCTSHRWLHVFIRTFPTQCQQFGTRDSREKGQRKTCGRYGSFITCISNKFSASTATSVCTPATRGHVWVSIDVRSVCTSSGKGVRTIAHYSKSGGTSLSRSRKMSFDFTGTGHR